MEKHIIEAIERRKNNLNYFFVAWEDQAVLANCPKYRESTENLGL
jgi:hypothetical protein